MAFATLLVNIETVVSIPKRFINSNFLDQNLDFVSVQGRYLTFALTDNEIIHTPKNGNDEANYAVTAEDIYSRLVMAYNPYKDQMVSMHRTNFFIKAFRPCTDFTNHFMAELATILVPMCYGKHKVLQILWMVRDSYKFFRPNAYKISEAKKPSASSVYFGVVGHEKIQREVGDFLKSRECQIFKGKFANEISELVSDVMHLSAVESGLLKCDTESFDLHINLIDTLRLVKERVRQNKLKLEFF